MTQFEETTVKTVTLACPECDYSVYVVRQASRRSWRIGQTRPVKVVFMSYRNTLQADALKLMAKKMQSVPGCRGGAARGRARGLRGRRRRHDDGAGPQDRSGDEEDEAETMEEVFAQARNAESEAEELLVDEGWKAVEVEPTVVETHRNGNGHAANGAELVMGNGRHVSANGNGRHEEAAEGQQTLFSWAEFMAEEPAKPKGRSRKAQPASTSLFDWALDMEKEREEELVGLSA